MFLCGLVLILCGKIINVSFHEATMNSVLVAHSHCWKLQLEERGLSQQAWRDPNTKKITQRFWKRHFFYLYEHIHPPIFLNRALGGFWEKCISLFGADFQPIFTQPLPSGLLWGGFINFLVIGHHRGWPRINFIFCSFSFFAIFGPFFAIFGPFFQFWALFFILGRFCIFGWLGGLEGDQRG